MDKAYCRSQVYPLHIAKLNIGFECTKIKNVENNQDQTKLHYLVNQATE